MTNDALATQLAGLPVRLLHHLAKKRVHRHFRMGKNRLIQSLLALSPGQRTEVETALASLLQEPARPSKPSRPGKPPQPKHFAGDRTLTLATCCFLPFLICHVPRKESINVKGFRS